MEAPREGLRFGRYELVRRLGAGGMGEVWEAVLHGPEGFRKAVALKLLLGRSGRAADTAGLAREARLGALLSHPNVVGTHDLGEADGRWYLALELVRGPSLDGLLRDRPLSGAAVVEVGVQACAGLAHVHAFHVDGRPAGLLHRDVKPSNLLLDRSGLVKLADLGVARWAQGEAEWGGTPGYLPPEQGEGREERRSDLFALGVTLFVLATGELPFGSGIPALLEVGRAEERLAQGLCAPLDAVVPGLAAVVGRCLRADPADRWPDAAALGEALAALRADAAGEPLHALLARLHPELAPALAPTPRPVRDRASLGTVALAVGNLPPERDGFLGRRDELARVTALVHEGLPLIVIKGLGGLGKTRLSLAVARQVARDLPGGSWFVELADATTAAGVLGAFSAALQIPLGADPVRQLARAMAYRGRSLFVLDNVEQVAHALPETLGAWLPLVPEATFLLTSRVAPRLTGERIVELEPLALDDAVDLFLERSPRPPSVAERGAVASLVEALDRLPLAIELAAARTRLLSVDRIRQRLHDRLRLLADGDRDRPARQRSMIASLDASWELATEAARAALVQLTVFDGGFTLEAADGVVDLGAIADARWMVDVLAELVDASLVRAEPDGERFRMTVIVAEWARTRAPDGALAAAERRHGAWFAQWGSEESVAWVRRSAGTRGPVVAGDLDNLVTAARRALARGDGATAAGACHAAAALLLQRGPLDLLLELTGALLARPDLPDRDRMRGWFAVSSALGDGGSREDARRAMAEAARLAEGLGDRDTWVTVLGMQARMAQREGRTADAAALVARANALAADADPDTRLSAVLHEALVHLSAGRLTEGRDRMTVALGGALRAGDLRRETAGRNNLGLLHLYLGELARAEAEMELALALGQRTGDRRGEVVARTNLGSVRWQLGRLEECRASWGDAARTFGEIGDESGTSTCHSLLGAADHEAGHPAVARRRLADAMAAKQRQGAVFGEMQVRTVLAGLEFDCGELDACAAHLSLAREWATRAGHHQMLALVEARTAALALERRDLAAAAEAVARAEASVARAGSSEALVGLVRGRWLLAAGRVDDGRAALAEAAAAPDFCAQIEASAELAASRGDGAALDALARRTDAGGYVRLGALVSAHRAAVRAAAGDAVGAAADRQVARSVADAMGYGPDAPLRRLLAET